MTLSKRYVNAMLSIGVAWCVAQFLIIHYNLRFPGADIFQFKMPGVELATRGTLTGVSLPNAPIGVRTVYAFYPPLFPFLFGIWLKCFGVSYGSSVFFDSLWRLARSAMILIWVLRLLRPHRFWDRPGRAIAIIVFLSVVTFFPNNEDRPDEMGLTFVLMSLYMSATRPFKLWAITSGILLGLSAAASPTAGMFGAMGTIALLFRSHFRALVVLGGTSFLVLTAICLPIVLIDHTAIERFAMGARYNVLPQHNRSSFARGGHSGFSAFLFQLKQAYSMGRPMYLCVLSCLVAVVATCRTKVPSKIPWQIEILSFASLFMIVSCIIFPIEPLYLWFSCCTIWVVVLAKWWLAPNGWRSVAALVCLFSGVSLMAVREVKLVFDTVHRAPDQSLVQIQGLLGQILKDGQLIAVSADAFFSAPWGAAENLDFVCSQVSSRYDYAFMTDAFNFTSISNRPEVPKLTSLCFWTPRCFELVKDYRSFQQTKVFGVKVPYYARGYGGVLYRNICKLTGVIPPY